jgi:glycosyltransferase involved in cell wall biosynthesis
VAARTADLLADPERAARMGAAARRIVSERFLAAAMGRAYRSLLGEVVGGAP